MINLNRPLNRMACCGYQQVWDNNLIWSFFAAVSEKEATQAYELCVKQNDLIVPSRQSKPFLIQLNKQTFLVGHALSGNAPLEDIVDKRKAKVVTIKGEDKLDQVAHTWVYQPGTFSATVDNPFAAEFKQTFTYTSAGTSPVGYRELSSFGVQAYTYGQQYKDLKRAKFNGVIGVTFNEFHDEYQWQLDEVQRLLKEEDVLYHHEFRNPRYNGDVDTKDSHRLCTVFFKFKEV